MEKFESLDQIRADALGATFSLKTDAGEHSIRVSAQDLQPLITALLEIAAETGRLANAPKQYHRHIPVTWGLVPASDLALVPAGPLQVAISFRVGAANFAPSIPIALLETRLAEWQQAMPLLKAEPPQAQ